MGGLTADKSRREPDFEALLLGALEIEDPDGLRVGMMLLRDGGWGICEMETEMEKGAKMGPDGEEGGHRSE